MRRDSTFHLRDRISLSYRTFQSTHEKTTTTTAHFFSNLYYSHWKQNKFSAHKKCHAFYKRKKNNEFFHVLPFGNVLDMHFLLFLLEFFFFSWLHAICCLVLLLQLVAHVLRLYVEQVIFFVFSLLLHYSFRCHFCSIYLNCKNTRETRTKTRQRVWNVE